MSAIEIAASWRLLSPKRARRTVIKQPKHSLSVGEVVKDWRSLSLRTDCEVALPSELAMNMLECTDRFYLLRRTSVWLCVYQLY